MDIAIVTGAETPLGLNIIQGLVRQGFRVHGIGNNFSKVTFADSQFFAHPVDLCDLAAVSAVMEQIIEKECSLDLLVHALDVTPGAAFEKLSVGNLEAVLKIGLFGPVLLTRLALPNLLRFRGQLINVIPANKSGAPSSAVNALIEGGLREMNRALFDRARDAGLRVTNLILRQNPEPDSLAVKSSEQTHIDLEDVARAVEHLIDPNFANVPAELVLHPRASAQADQVLPDMPLPLDPYSEVVLPPKAYCPPEQPKIPTVEKQRVDRSIPYTDDEMEDKIAAAIEDFEAHPERYERPEPKPERAPKPAGPHPDSSESGDGAANKRRRGRRRGGRNRNRDRDRDRESATPPASDGQQKAQTGEVKNNKSGPAVSGESQAKPDQPAARSNRGGRKPVRKADRHSEGKPQKEPQPPAEKAPAVEAPKEAPAKKATKKAAKKATK
ncbi:MAG: SDR family NAD(P)-dependent oxidoreductase, partial [Puniceicoccaceae bacterium]